MSYRYEEEEKLPYKKQKLNEQQEEEEEEEEEYGDYGDLEDEELDEEDLLQAIEEAEQDKSLAFDQESLITLINQFEKHIIKNEQLREQFQSKPEQFMQSEVELDEDIKKFYNISAYPEYICIFGNSSAVKCMVELLAHKNDDIRVEILGFLKEVLSLEFEKEEEEEKYSKDINNLAQKFVDNAVLEGLYQNLLHFKEQRQEEYEAIFKILEIIELFCDNDAKFIVEICQKTKILSWVLKRIEQNAKNKVLDDNRYYCSEILTTLLSGDQSIELFLVKGGIEQLIQVLASYKSKNPESEEEKEFVLNLFNSLNLCLIQEKCQEEFRGRYGIDLMIKMIKEKKFCSKVALQALSFAVQNNQVSCNYLIEVQALKYLLPIMLMKGIKSKKEDEQKSINESIFSIAGSLIKNSKGLPLERVINKFRENDFEKIDRLFEIHGIYFGYINELTRRTNNPQYLEQLMKSQDMSKEEVLEMLYMRKQDKGLSILEQTNYIILVLLNWKDKDISQRVKKKVTMHDTLQEHFIIAKERIQNLDQDNSQKEIEQLEQLITQSQQQF